MMEQFLLAIGAGLGAIVLLMLVAKITGMVHVEDKQGVKPVYNMEAVVKGKRTLVEADEENPAIPQTTYFVTFQKRDGTRVELKVPGADYGLCAEGDEGILVWQGDDFVVFKRTN